MHQSLDMLLLTTIDIQVRVHIQLDCDNCETGKLRKNYIYHHGYTRIGGVNLAGYHSDSQLCNWAEFINWTLGKLCGKLELIIECQSNRQKITIKPESIML